MTVQGFDWVKARAECDDILLFTKLREAVRSNCESARQLSEKKNVLAGIVFDGDTNPNNFSVMRRHNYRLFSLEKDRIVVRSQEPSVLHEAKALLVGERCLLEVGKELMSPAEFARLVLEDFFFTPSG